ncbi:hypothetical protein AB0C59_25080 [Streptomyces sp. NPDC048664]|uniref:hypothetical protein n=1 Tax=Streptomyces sp. NPDC048664 TaxID=3154505 RepID=UPI00342042DF
MIKQIETIETIQQDEHVEHLELIEERERTARAARDQRVRRIERVLHESTAPVGPAGVALALAVAHELHGPAAQAPGAYEIRALQTRRALAPRAPEVPCPQMMGLRVSAARTHRRKVPLNRLTAVLG